MVKTWEDFKDLSYVNGKSIPNTNSLALKLALQYFTTYPF